MIRGTMATYNVLADRDFRWRGTEISRLEGFSDAVFAFAVTLLVVSLEVPRTFIELMTAMRGFAAFAICFAILAQIWFKHYRFFRRYGLQNSWAVFLNCLLLFFVLFYVYPLKFLFSGLFSSYGRIESSEARTLLVIYGAGYAAVFGVFALLHLEAWRQRDALDLNPLERLKTRHSIIEQIAMVAIGLISIVLALTLPANLVGLAGWFYIVISLYYAIAGSILGKRERLLAQATGALQQKLDPHP
jgi:uncharacterized membrane protein